MYVDKLKTYKLLYVILIIIFGVIAGTRTSGFDYPDYLVMFSNVMKYDGLLEKISYSKDPVVGIIIAILEPDGKNDYRSVFLSFSLATAFFNILVIQRIKTKWQLNTYFLMYLFFFYPSLDYTAIRAGLAFPLMILSLINLNDRRYVFFAIFSLLSIISHYSSLVGILCFLFTFYWRTQYVKYLLIPFIIVIASQSSIILSLFKQTAVYQLGHGSIFSYVAPLFTFLSFYIFDKYILLERRGFAKTLVVCALFLSCFCLGFSQVNVTVSHRLLQISHYIFLCAVCFTSLPLRKNNYIKLCCAILFVIPLYMRNFLTVNLWEPLVNHLMDLPIILFY